MSSSRPSYLRVFLTFARNSLVRDMTFRANFFIDCISSISWVLMQFGLYLLIYYYTPEFGGWHKYEFFVFLATGMFINSIVQAFFMPNMEQFSELVNMGGLDFALLKPIDTQFLISLQKVEWSALSNFVIGVVLLIYSLLHLSVLPDIGGVLLYPIYVLCGVGIMYSFMIALAATSIWLGRNQNLYDFWFYITNFSRYPTEIYGSFMPFQFAFTFIIPVLVAVNVPARMMARPLTADQWPLAVFAVVATAVSMLASRWMFTRALLSYRSASS